MREFREQLAQYLESEVPIAVTKHGRTVGLYIPLRNRPADEDLAALRAAGRRLDEWMAGPDVTEDELVTEFKARRKAGRRKRGG
jgi:antitoxin (DNA-binding transcriptional repressor) of toxin-antitoxin stability system